MATNFVRTFVRLLWVIGMGCYFSVFILSCSKDNNDEVDFDLQGLTDLEAHAGESKMIHLSANQTKGKSDSLKLILNNLPDGVSYEFTNVKSKPNFTKTLLLIVSNQVKLGQYTILLKASIGKCKKSIPFVLTINNDKLSMVMTIYDATAYSCDFPFGKPADSATIRLYTDKNNFFLNNPCYIVNTDKHGEANFYHLLPGSYLFIVEKENLSNIAEKKLIDNEEEGFVIIGIFTTSSEIHNSAQPTAHIGQLRYRDLNGDEKITDADRTFYDVLLIYDNVISKKVIWIGK